jgi:hypothetical protein
VKLSETAGICRELRYATPVPIDERSNNTMDHQTRILRYASPPRASALVLAIRVFVTSVTALSALLISPLLLAPTYSHSFYDGTRFGEWGYFAFLTTRLGFPANGGRAGVTN